MESRPLFIIIFNELLGYLDSQFAVGDKKKIL